MCRSDRLPSWKGEQAFHFLGKRPASEFFVALLQSGEELPERRDLCLDRANFVCGGIRAIR